MKTLDDLLKRLRARRAFGLNGATWIMLNEPDPDCIEAADEIEALMHDLDRHVDALVQAETFIDQIEQK